MLHIVKKIVLVFGENARQQCVAMRLCALIYGKIRRITSVDDMIQVMTFGGQLYSSLSLLTTQSMLLLTELTEMVTVFERIFQLEYSESYTCNMHGDARIEGYYYCMSLKTLLALNYNPFILTVGIIGVNSHARDMYGNSCWKYHPCINLYNIFRVYIHVGMRIYMSLKVYNCQL